MHVGIDQVLSLRFYSSVRVCMLLARGSLHVTLPRYEAVFDHLGDVLFFAAGVGSWGR